MSLSPWLALHSETRPNLGDKMQFIWGQYFWKMHQEIYVWIYFVHYSHGKYNVKKHPAVTLRDHQVGLEWEVWLHKNESAASQVRGQHHHIPPAQWGEWLCVSIIYQQNIITTGTTPHCASKHCGWVRASEAAPGETDGYLKGRFLCRVKKMTFIESFTLSVYFVLYIGGIKVLFYIQLNFPLNKLFPCRRCCVCL